MDSFPLQFTAPKVKEPSFETYMEQAITLNGHGDLNRIKVEDAPVPEFIEDDLVEVEVFYCGLNFMDNYLRLGIIRNTDFPVIMGSECSGIAPASGYEVCDIEEGQRVLCLKMQGGLFHGIAQVPRKNCFPVPDNIRLIDAVGLGLNFLVAYLCLFDLARLRTGQTVFMQSIAGGVGTAVVQLARLVPLVKIVGTASVTKHEKLRALGVDRVFRHDENYVGQILEEYPGGADIVINTNGGVDIEKCLKLVKACGRLINIGSNSTAIYPKTKFWGLKRPSWDTRQISTTHMIKRNCAVIGLNVGDYLENDTKKVQKILTTVFQLYTREQIHPQIHSILEFEKVVDGMRQLCSRENCGKVILSVQDEAARLEVPEYVLNPPRRVR
ncbi:synaptic vesicle membrane protein VAT-1 homolog [Schistocerca gregaria]|uniref:synaptic vesicle membrane protein VAT-1 homolog n=1 Tax=Schistocerca gregaria TaxID=7010 RepID=UPI00211E7A19|nr:synaptic vesicle membrane protein VAT-1 homolog [Schistocerca gregaria]